MQWKPPPPEAEPERAGLDPGDERWDVPWLKGLRRVPKDAVWPRLMTVPHPRAVGSLGPEVVKLAEQRAGVRLRWWQKLVAARVLEVDSAGELVWETVVWSMARQLGKSWLLRELIWWRVLQAERFGEPQDVMHTGKDVAICKEIQRPVRAWAKARREDFKVTEVNGQEQIEHLADGSRWMIRAKEAVYGYACSVAAVDEAWKVKAATIEDGLTPTMVERDQPQLWLVSTAHRLATELMLERRRVALAGLEEGDGDLLIEWSAPADAELDDVERLAARLPALDAEARAADRQAPGGGQAGRGRPERRGARSRAVLPFPVAEPVAGAKDGSAGQHRGLAPGRALGLAGGLRARHGAADRRPGGRLRPRGGGRRGLANGGRPDRRRRLDDRGLGRGDSRRRAPARLERPVSELYVGASLLDRMPKEGFAPRAVGMTEARAGLAVFRDLAATGMLAHEDTAELDSAIAQTQVRESPSGLVVAQGPSHLIKAVVWAVLAAHRPAQGSRHPLIGVG